MEMNGAVHEGRAAYVLGSGPGANPYRKAKDSYRELVARNVRLTWDDEKHGALVDLECQWDSGYAIARRKEVAR